MAVSGCAKPLVATYPLRGWRGVFSVCGCWSEKSRDVRDGRRLITRMESPLSEM